MPQARLDQAIPIIGIAPPTAAPDGERRTKMSNPNEETAILGGGCFWCTEAVFKDLRGVRSVKSGYAGGHTPNPTYKQVCGGATGHAEVLRVIFDPTQIDYADLLRIFFTIHDPTTRNRQGNDVGPQYRSIILVTSDEQLHTAHAVATEITGAGLYADPLTTEILRLEKFWPAEEEHEDYFARNPGSGYCQVVVAPKVRKFRKAFSDRLKAEAA
jgi:peptide-methionine (S)-S-oxide reductase